METCQPRIYLRDVDLKSIPPAFSHRLIPILFAEKGEMPSSKGKAKLCCLVVNLAGIYFFRPQAMTTYKLSQFLSTYSVSRITWLDPKKRSLSSSSLSTYFSCRHADEAVAWIIAARRVMFLGIVDPTPVVLDSFPVPPVVPPAEFLVSPKDLPQIRYVCLSERYDAQPMESFIELFCDLDPERNKSLVLDESCGGPENLKCLVRPIIQLGQFTTIHFKGFAPYSACRLVHYFLKRSNTIRTVILENYSFLMPCQLRFARIKLSPAGPLSLIFMKCPLPSEIFGELMNELSAFEGEYQRFTFQNLELSPGTCESLFGALECGRPFRTLEVLELNYFTMRQPIKDTVELVTKGFGRAIEHIRFLKKFSCVRWSIPFWVPLSLFEKMGFLHEIVLQRFELTQLFDGVNLPPVLHLLNVSSSSFTADSLVSFLRMVGRAQARLCLVMQDLVLSDEHWQIVYQSLGQLSPPRCIVELDWSGNHIHADFQSSFVKYFFGENQMVGLSLDKLFKVASLAELDSLLESLANKKLWSLSIGGGFDSNFSDNFGSFLQVIDKLDSIAILKIDSQKMSESDIPVILDFLRRHPNIQDFSCDDTALTSEEHFLAFYNDLFQLNIPAIGRPLTDVAKFFQRAAKTGAIGGNFDTFRANIQRRHQSSTQSIRAYYFGELEKQGVPAVQELQRLSDRFPLCFSDPRVSDPFALMQNKDIPHLISLDLLHIGGRSLSELHEARVHPATQPPFHLQEGRAQIEAMPSLQHGASVETMAVFLADDMDPEVAADIEIEIEPLEQTEEFALTMELLGATVDDDELIRGGPAKLAEPYDILEIEVEDTTPPPPAPVMKSKTVPGAPAPKERAGPPLELALVDVGRQVAAPPSEPAYRPPQLALVGVGREVAAPETGVKASYAQPVAFLLPGIDGRGVMVEEREPPYRPPTYDIVRGIEAIAGVDLAGVVQRSYVQDVSFQPRKLPDITFLGNSSRH
jgi:hypothetical protein